MHILNTGKALALSVFLHFFMLAIAVDAFDCTTESNGKKRIDYLNQKSIIHISLIEPLDVQVKSQNTSIQPTDTQKDIGQLNQTKAQSKSSDKLEETQKTTAPDAELLPLRATKYYSSDEVLEPAQPVSVWALNDLALPPGHVHQIFIQIWVLETGEFEKFELIDASLTDDIARLATINLLQTPMFPAMQDGKPVASTRKLAILIDKDE